MSNRSFACMLAAIALLALAMRIGLRAMRGAADFFTNGYLIFLQMGQAYAHYDALAPAERAFTATRPALYPLFLWATGATSGHFWPVLLAEAMLSTGTVVLTALIGRRLFGSGCGLLAGTIAAIYPYAAWHDTALQETGMFAFLTMLSLWLLLHLREERRWWQSVAAGLALGLAVLTRETILPLVAFAPLWLAAPTGDGARLSRRLLTAGLTAAVAALTIAPWLVHTDRVLGAPVMSAESGRQLYVANNALTFSFYPQGSIDDSARLIMRRMPAQLKQELRHSSVLGRQAILRQAAMRDMAAHPWRTVRYAVAKNIAAFGPLPSPRKSPAVDLLNALTWTPIFLLGLAGLVLSRRNWRRDALFYALIGGFVCLTAVMWAHTSHRSHLDYSFMIFAAHALVRLLGSERGRWVLAVLPPSVRRAVAREAGLSGA